MRGRPPKNRCFSKTPTQKEKEEQIKKILIDARQRKLANRQIDALLDLFHHKKTIRELLPAMRQKGYPRYVIEVAIERAERRLADDDVAGRMEIELFKNSLAEAK